MAISSFYGLQTSLRGLLAQQRLLDTTGHNIANASTQGYSRQEAVLQASPALQIPSGTATGAGAHLGSGVDVLTYRRVRDSFIDLQYRAQNTNLQDWTARSAALDQAEGSLNEPGDNGINAQLAKFWDAWNDVANAHAPDDLAAKQALVEQAQSLGDAFGTVRAQMSLVQQQTRAQYDDLTRPATAGDPGGEVAQAASEIAQLNDTIKRYVTVGDTPNDLLDRRDLLLDKLSGYGQVSVESNTDGSINVSFVDTAASGTTYGIVDGTTATWAGAPSSWSPGGELGGLLKASDPTTGTVQGYVDQLDTIAGNVATLVNGTYGTFFETGPGPAAASLRVTATLADDPRQIRAGSGNEGSTDVAAAVAALRNHVDVDGAYRAFVAKVGAEVKAADRQATNAQTLTDSVEDRRQSVAGVSMDEEMANLVRFQRGYQASARAMSTMDEMLDVLINRTGRVGL
jgi:flagellar hook-associated protein 1 FlgK